MIFFVILIVNKLYTFYLSVLWSHVQSSQPLQFHKHNAASINSDLIPNVIHLSVTFVLVILAHFIINNLVFFSSIYANTTSTIYAHI